MNCCASNVHVVRNVDVGLAGGTFVSFETLMLGSLHLCLVLRNVNFGFGTPYVDVGLAAPSCHSKRQVRGWPSCCSSCGCWASCSTRWRSVLYTLASFDMWASSAHVVRHGGIELPTPLHHPIPRVWALLMFLRDVGPVLVPSTSGEWW